VSGIEIGDELIVKVGCIITHWHVTHTNDDWVTLLTPDKRRTASITPEKFLRLKVWSDKAKESLARIEAEELAGIENKP
jgi:hypothetical protein